MAVHTFKLKDRQGAEHYYEVTAFGAREGSALRYRIAAVVSEPLLAAVYEVARGGDIVSLATLLLPVREDATPEQIAAIEEKRADMLEKISPARLGASVRTALAAIPSDLTVALLRNVKRDGEMIGLVPDLFDAAYARNYGELDGALWEVVAYEGFLSLPATQSGNN